MLNKAVRHHCTSCLNDTVDLQTTEENRTASGCRRNVDPSTATPGGRSDEPVHDECRQRR